jgi:hypothetical protein
LGPYRPVASRRNLDEPTEGTHVMTSNRLPLLVAAGGSGAAVPMVTA